jgi:MFS family permease
VLAAGTGLFHSAALGGVGGVFGPFVLHTLDLSLFAASLMLIPAIIAGGLSMFVAGRRSRPGNRLRELAIFYSVGAVGLIVLAFVNTWYLFAIVGLTIGVSLGGASPLMGATMLDVSYGGARKASVLGWLFFAQGIGTVIGPFLVGFLISLAGVREAVAAVGVFEGVFVGLLLAAWRRERI